LIANFLQFVFAFVLVLAPLVFIHELGHFLAAKLFGIGVPVFSLGFGPRLFGFRHAGTDYRLSLIPLGGYVRMCGDEADENRTGAPEEFLSKPKWQRFVVFVAGATFNIILAFCAIWLLFGVYGMEEPPATTPTVLRVQSESPAERAGILSGDELVSIGGTPVEPATFFDTYNLEIVLAPNSTKRVVLERDGKSVAVDLFTGADPKHGWGSPGWLLAMGGEDPAVLNGVIAGDRAEAAGLLAGDRIVAVDGRGPVTQLELRILLMEAVEKELLFSIDRDGTRLELPIVPRDNEGRGFIGVEFIPKPSRKRDVSLGQAARASFDENLKMSKTLFVILKRLVTRELSPRTMSGPIGIAQVARQAIAAGPEFFLGLLGFFSLQLGILNLLPIPVLDGGHILILFIEGLIRRDLSDRIKERVMLTGLVFLLLFMMTIVYFDVVKTI